MAKETFTRPLTRSNREFLGYINKSTKHIYMLSEFIDNSVQSAIDEGLKITVKIIVNMQQECIYIIDNAAGIEFDDITKVMKNGNDDDEVGDNLNMFGVGMKMASIWFGRRLTIFTKSIKENYAHKSVLDVDELPKNDFSIITTKDINIEEETGFDIGDYGTVIKIDRLHLNETYKDRYKVNMFFKKGEDNWDSLESQILFRFSRQIKSGDLVVSLSYINDKGKELIITNDGNPIVLNKNSVLEYCIDNRDYFYDGVNIKDSKTVNYEKKFNEIKEIYKNKMNDNIGFENLTYADIFRKFDNQEKFEFETYFTVEDDNNPDIKERIKFKFGYLKKIPNLSKYFGLNAFQDNRAVVSGPNSTTGNVNWLTFDRAFSKTYYNISLRFFGEVDLNNKKMFKVDNNKMGFQDGVKKKIESAILKKFEGTNGLGDLFGKLLNLIEYNRKKKDEENSLQQETSRFVGEFEKNSILPNHTVKNITVDLIFENNEYEKLPAFYVESKADNQDKVIFCWRVVEKNNPKNLFSCSVKTNEDNPPYLIVEVNSSFFGFSSNIKKDAFKILMNPITKLVLMELSRHNDSEAKYNALSKILEGFDEK